MVKKRLCAGAFFSPDRILGNNHPEATGQGSYGFRVRQSLVGHRKADGVSEHAAPETLVDLFTRGDGKRRRFFLVKRAAGNVIFPRLF